MSLTLHTIKPFSKSRKKRKRIGRGLGSGGTYSGKGQKGQRARSGGRKGLKLKGLKQMLLGIPKVRGFKSPYLKMAVVNLGDLDKKFKDGDKVTPQILKKTGLVNNIENGVKILGKGEMTKRAIFEGFSFSVSAKDKIEKVGGKIS
jgi:large subunit ribosomal protein L15